MNLSTIGVVITDAIKFVQTNKKKLTMFIKGDNNKESEELDYDCSIAFLKSFNTMINLRLQF
jgi:hypothetical protein